MNFLSTYIPEPIIKALGWALLHSLWQGIITAVILALVLLLLHRQSAAIRYTVSVIAMLVFIMATIVTFSEEYAANAGSQLTVQKPVVYALGFPAEVISTENIRIPSPTFLNTGTVTAYFNRHLPLIVLVWAVGIAVLLLRFMGGLAYIQHLKTYKTQNLPEHWQKRFIILCTKVNIQQPIRLAESALVKVPIAIGHLKPVILLPVGTMLGLPAEQVEAILAHELAHICRKDYLVNIFQCIVEILFFFHPAIWWISARIREEREHGCDDMALRLCEDSLTFAKALANLENVNASTPALSLSITGKKTHLLQRIQRLLGQPRKKPEFMEGFLAACVLMASLLAVSVSAGTTFNKNLDKPFDRANNELISDISTQEAYADSLKNKDKGTFTYKGTKNGKKYNIKATMEGDEITRLIVDGKKIPSGEIENYRSLIQELMGNVPLPPTPPTPFAAIPPTPPFTDFDEKSFSMELEDNMDINIDPMLEVPDMEIELEPIEPLEPMEPMEAIEPTEIGSLLREAFENDTTKKKNHHGEFSISHKRDNKQHYKIKINDGEITELEVDGKKIPKEAYKNYQYIVEEIEEDNEEHRLEAMARREEVRENREEERQRIVELREEMHREQVRARERMQIERDKLIRRQEEHRIEHDKARARLERDRDLQMREREMEFREREEGNRANAMAKRKIDMEKRDELIKQLTSELEKDKLIKNKKNYKFKIDSSGLTVEGKKQSKDLFDKYKLLIETQTGKPFNNYSLEYNIKD